MVMATFTKYNATILILNNLEIIQNAFKREKQLKNCIKEWK
jgi:predicted GIY-YIG superfamily endonuclease